MFQALDRSQQHPREGILDLRRVHRCQGRRDLVDCVPDLGTPKYRCPQTTANVRSEITTMTRLASGCCVLLGFVASSVAAHDAI